MKYIQNIPIEGFCLGNENLYSIQQSNVHMKISGKILIMICLFSLCKDHACLSDQAKPGASLETLYLRIRKI